MVLHPAWLNRAGCIFESEERKKLQRTGYEDPAFFG